MLCAPPPASRQNLVKLADIFWDNDRNVITSECLWCGNWFAYGDSYIQHLTQCNRVQIKLEAQGLMCKSTPVVSSASEPPAVEDLKLEVVCNNESSSVVTAAESPPASPSSVLRRHDDTKNRDDDQQPEEAIERQHNDRSSRRNNSRSDDDANGDDSTVTTAPVFSRLLLKHLEEHATSKSFIICDLCGHSAKNRTNILLHWRTEHLHKALPPAKRRTTTTTTTDGSSATPKPPKTFACPHCTEIFATYRLRLLHKQRTHRLHVCEFCGTAFGNPRNLTYHRRIHTGERPYVCQHCQRCFSTPGEHLLHERMHTGERPYACTLCPMRYPLSRLLKGHMRRHAGERPHACTICPKRFYTSTDLRDHGRSHTGERPYECRMVGCSRRYLSATARNIHEKSTMHVGGVRKPGMESISKGGRGLVYKF